MKRSPMKRHPRPEAATLRIYGTPERQEWLHQQPCCICGRRPIQAHHVKTSGTSRKSDARFLIPLCHQHHQYIHDHGRSSFNAKHQVDVFDLADKTDADFHAYEAERER